MAQINAQPAVFKGNVNGFKKGGRGRYVPIGLHVKFSTRLLINGPTKVT